MFRPIASCARRFLFVAFVFVIGVGSSYAQKPVNDSCQAAIEVKLGTGGFAIGTFQSDSISMDSATVQIGEYFHSSLVSAGNDKKTVWFKFYIPARRGVNIELKQNANAIATKDCGFTTYLSDQCLPNGTNATNAKLTTLNQFGSSFHPCMDPGWYMVQVSAKSRAVGKIYLEITTIFPHQYPAVVNAEYDDQDSAYDFGNQLVGKPGSQSSYRDFELGCYTISDSSEFYPDLGANYLAYNQSAWFVFTSNKDHDDTQFKFRHVSGCATNDTMAFRLYRGDCRGGGSLTLLDSSFNDWTTAYTCYGNCSDVVKDYRCTFDSGVTYSVQLLFHKDLTKTMRFYVYDQTSQYDSGFVKPTTAVAGDLGTVSGSRTVNYGFSCDSYIADNSCGSANASSIIMGNYGYNLAQWYSFEVKEQSRLDVRTWYGVNGNYKRYGNLAFRLFKDTITSSCSDIDTNNIVLSGNTDGTYTITCLDPGKYSIQLLGTDTIRDLSSWDCDGSFHLGGDYRLTLTQSRLPVANKFALTNIGDGDSIYGLNDLPLYSTVNAQLDTISCNDAVQPEDVCDSTYKKAMYRTFVVGDADNDGNADSGMVFTWNLQNGYRSYPFYDYNSWHRIYKGNALSLRASQSVTAYPDTLKGLIPVSQCFPQSSTQTSACLEPGEYTLVSFFDSTIISLTEQPRLQFYSARSKFNAPSKASLIDSISAYGNYYAVRDSFTCATNPDTIDGVYCGRRNAYYVFYLDTLSVTTINIGYSNYYYAGHRFTLFAGDIRNGKSGVNLYDDGLGWKCTGYYRSTSDCRPLPAGWYTVVVSNDWDISYDSTNRTTNGDNRALYTYPTYVSVTTRASSVTPPKYYRPQYAAYIDSLVNNNQPLSYDTNYSTINGTVLNLARFNFPREVLECDLDTPMNHYPKSALCDTNTTDIVYYTFNLAKDAFVRIWGNTSGGTWDMKLFDFDVRKDSSKLATATPVQDCNYNANYLEFCNLQSGTYSIIYYCKRNAGQTASVEPVMHIDSVIDSRFDHAANAYDFGKIPGNGTFYDGKIGDSHPTNSALPASHDMITCRTGAQMSDPTGSSCYNHVNPYVYSGDTNVAFFPYDSSYYYANGQSYYPWNYAVRRNLWYSFVVEGRGNVTVDLKGNVSGLISPQSQSVRYSIYESDEDGSLSLAALKSAGKIDSTTNDGLTYITEDYTYCYYTSDQSATFPISSCEKVKPRRYYILVETTNYYNRDQKPNVNHNVWLEIKYDSLYIPDTKYDFYSTANDINQYNSTSVFQASTLYRGDSTYFAGSTLDTTDYNRTYYYSSCSDPNVAGTVWYKFDVDSTGYLHYNYFYSYLSGSTTLLRTEYDANRIRVYRSVTDGDSLAGLQYVQRISTSGTFYNQMGGYANYICVNPGTYYIQINKCSSHECSDYVYPQLVFDYHTGDFCETAVPLQIDSLQQVAGRLLVNCHTIGTDFGEDGSDMGCLYGPKDYKSSWFVVDYTDTTKVDLEFKLGEYTNATAGEIRYRTYYGNCKSLTSAPCNNNALTTFTLDCIRKGTYYVQVVTPDYATGELEMSVEAKENTDTTCNPVDIFQPNAAFYYNTACPENVIEFVNTSSRGDSIRYFWDFGYNGLTDTALNPVITYPASSVEQSYNVKLVVEQITRGSKDSIEITIDVPYAPDLQIVSNDTNLCLGDSVTLTATLSHGDGVWNTGDTTSSITVRETGWYTYEQQEKPNLLKNGSFELHPGSSGDWTILSGQWTRSASNNYAPQDSTYVVYCNSSSGGLNEIYQDVDVSFDSIDIDSGIAKTSLTGLVRTYSNFGDEAQLLLEYYDANNNLLGLYQSGFISSPSSWQALTHSRTTPKGTRRLRVRVQSYKNSTSNSNSYAFFDKLRLKMRSACDYIDSVYVQVNPIPVLSLPKDSVICPEDSLFVDPTITYHNPYVIQDSMNSTLSGSLKNSATHTASNGYVELTSDLVNAENGQIEWEDSSLSLTDSFTISFDYYSGGKTAYALWFYMFATTTPTQEDFASGGYSVAFDRNNSNSLQTEWNNSRINTTYPGINMDDGQWHKVKIKYNNQQFEIYFDGELILTLSDGGSRTQTGFKFGIGARSYYYNTYRVKNFQISRNNDESVVITPPSQRNLTYLWSDASTDSTRWVSPTKTLTLKIVDAFGCESNSDTIEVSSRSTQDSLFTSVENICSLLDSFTLTKPDSLGFFYGHSAVDSNGLVLVNSTAFGTNEVYFQVTDTFGCLLRDTGYFIVDSIPTLNFSNAGPFCRNDTAELLSINHNDGYFYGGNFIDSTGWFDPSKTTQQVNRVYYITNSVECQALDSMDVVVDSIPDASVSNDRFCVDVGVQALQPTINTGGTFTTTPYLDSTGKFNPLSSGAGTFTVYYQFTDGNGCSASDSAIVVVDTLPDASIDSAGPFCANAGIQNLRPSVNTGGLFTQTLYLDTSGRFDPEMAGTGSHTAYYTFIDGNGCSSIDSTVVLVDSIPDPELIQPSNFCLNDRADTIRARYNSGGIFSGGSYIDTLGLFKPGQAGVGTHQVIYTFTDDNGCSSSDTIQVVVDSLPTAKINGSGPFCLNAGVQVVTAQGNGVFSATTYIDTSGNFDPSLAGVGNHKVYYSVTDGNGCSSSDSATIRVDSIPDASITQAGPFCENAGVQNLTGAVNTGGRFASTSYLDTAGRFDPAQTQVGSHKVFYSFTDGNGCSNTDSAIVVVDSIPDASIAAGRFCANASVQLLKANVNSEGKFTATTYLDTIGNFDPGVAGNGSFKVYYSFTDGNGCSNTDSATIVVDSIPNAAIQSAGPFCFDVGVQTVSAVNSGGTFTATSYLDTSGQFDPYLAGAGIHTIYYSITDGNGCFNTDSTTVQVDTLPDASITQAGPFCQNSGVQTLNGALNPGGRFTPTSYLDTAGRFDPAQAQVGSHKVFYSFTDGNGCSNTDSAIVVVDSIPDASITAGRFCANASAQLLKANVNNGGKFTPTTYLDTIGNFDPGVAGNGSFKVYYSFTDGNGCSNTDSATIVVDSIPNAAIQSAGPFCLNDGVQTISPVNAGGTFIATSYLDTAGKFDPAVAGAGNHLIYYTIADGNGCSNIDSLMIVVDTLPDASIVSAGPFCENAGTQTLTAAVNTGGRFASTSYLDTLGQFEPSIAQAGSHKVYYSFTDGNGCTNLDSTVVLVDSVPDASITPAGPFCENSGVRTLIPQINSGGRFTPTTYLDTNGNFDPGIALSGSHTVYYTFTDGNGCTTTDSTTIRVDTLPDASIIDPGNICLNAGIQSIQPTYPGGKFTGGSFIDSAGSFDPTLAGVGSIMIYYTINDGAGCFNTDSISIVIDSIPDASIVSNRFCENAGNQVIVPAVNSGGNFSGTSYLDVNGNFDPGISGSGSFRIYYSFTDGNGCSNTESTDIIVDTIPDAGIVPAGPFCENGGAQVLQPSVNSGGSFTITSYLDASGNFDPAQAGDGSHRIYYSFTDGNGCSNTDSTNVVVDSIPDASITAAGPFCLNAGVQTIVPEANTGGSFMTTVYLNASGDFDPALAGVGTHKVFYSFTDGNGCSNTDSASIVIDSIPDASINAAGPFCLNDGVQLLVPTFNSGGTFSGTGVDGSGNFDPAQANTGNHKIYYNVTDGNGCTGNDSTTIVVNGVPDASIVQAGPFCENNDVQTLVPTTNTGGMFSGNGVDGSGNFDPQSVAAGIHRIYYTYTDGNGCTAVDSSDIIVNAAPDAGITQAGPFCQNDATYQITPNTSGGSFSGGAYVDATGLFDPEQATVGLNKVVYSVTNSDGCTSADSIDVEVLSVPTNQLVVNPIEGCEPLVVNFATEPEDSIRWVSDGVERINIESWTDTFYQGIHPISLEAIAANGCKIQIDTTIEVFGKPKADFSYSPEKIYISNPQVFFSDLSTGNVVGWRWDFGDNDGASDQHPEHTYTSGGSYDVQLYIEDENGCLDSTMQTLVILDELILFIPNAISPNNDGVNDVFRIVGIGIVDVKIQIFNRWGERIYESDDFTQWDATYQGEKVQMGSYVYIMTVTDNRGVRHQKKGEVSVIR